MATLEEQIAALEREKQEQTDVFVTQENMIQTLTDILQQQDQPVWVEAEAPAKPPNYVLFIVLGIVGILLFKKL